MPAAETMQPAFLTVIVDEHDEIPDGCCMRFKVVSEPRPVHRIRCEADEDEMLHEWTVASCESDGSAGVAWGATVEDSGAGLCTLIYGGARGLRLRMLEGHGHGPRAEPYLLLAPEAVLE